MSDVDPWYTFERPHADPFHLTQADRRLLALGGLRTEVNNGGFHQYFFNSASDIVPDAVDAAEAAGVTELALLRGDPRVGDAARGATGSPVTLRS